MPNSTDQLLQATDLTDEGRRLLDKGRVSEAEARFRAAVAAFPLPAARNNWALCHFLSGDPSGALNILEPLLKDPSPAPYSAALASLALTKLGNELKAKAMLNRSTGDFDRGWRRPQLRAHSPEAAWVEYTVLIKRAAGTLGDHRLVLDLHRRWPGSDLPAGAYAAGAAAFNLGRYEQAERYWKRIAASGWRRPMEAYIRVAQLVQQGVVPPFLLEYDMADAPMPDPKATPEQVEAEASKGSVRATMVAYCFDPSAVNRSEVIASLITFGGDWGLELGRRLLAANDVPLLLKGGAAQALVDRGEFAQEQPIPARVDGREMFIQQRQLEVVELDPDLDRQYREALRLRDSGQKDKAFELLAEMQTRVFYPPAAMALANLLRKRGDLDEAQATLEALEKLAPDDPAVLFNLSGLWAQRNDMHRAGQYYRRIRPDELPAAARAELAEFGRLFDENPLTFDMDRFGDQYRADIEERRISPNLILSQALRKIPVEWLDAAARPHGVSARLRQERERRLAEALTRPASLGRTVAALEPKAKAALDFLISQGGVCKLQLLTNRFGRQDGDGFWWDEAPPASAVGRLRAAGLVFVGRALVDGRAHKVAVIPVELRGLLQ